MAIKQILEYHYGYGHSDEFKVVCGPTAVDIRTLLATCFMRETCTQRHMKPRHLAHLACVLPILPTNIARIAQNLTTIFVKIARNGCYFARTLRYLDLKVLTIFLTMRNKRQVSHFKFIAHILTGARRKRM